MNYYCFYLYYCYFTLVTFAIFFFIFIPSICNPFVAGEIYTSQFEIESIFKLQKEVVESVEKYLTKEQLRLNKIQLSLQRLATGESKLKRRSFGQDEDGLNPIDAYVLIKFLTTDLQIVLNSTTDSANSEELSNEIENLRKENVFPIKEDLSGAALALIRLQDTYLLNASSLSSGILNGHCCATILTADDCFEIGQHSYYSKNYKRTIEWMNEALEKLKVEGEKISSTETIINQLALPTSAIHKEVTEYLLWAKELQNIATLTDNFMSQTMGVGIHDIVDQLVSAAEYVDNEQDEQSKMNQTKRPSYTTSKLNYEALCRGETIKETSYDSKLNCSYHRNNNYYMLIGPVKQEILNIDPPIVMFHEVLHHEEIETIKKLSLPTFDTAQVLNYATGGSRKSEVRISKLAWLTEDDDDIVSKVNKRISLITGLSLLTAEDLQVANYGLGGHYAPHYDFSSENQVANFMTEEEGNRIATFLIYMSNVDAGGSTVFPSLGIEVRPAKGSAIFWYNLLENGQGDIRTLHAACPVLRGQKWVSNKWIHERGQEFLRSCRKIS